MVVGLRGHIVEQQQQQRRVDEAAEKFADALRDSYRAVADRTVSARELNVRLTQEFFNNVINNLRTQAESNREIARQLADEQRLQQESVQSFVRESVSAYENFLHSLFSYHRESLQTAEEATRGRMYLPERTGETVRLLDEWLADESGYDEETWPDLKEALDRDRPSARKLFVD